MASNNIAYEITRLQGAADLIKSKTVSLGLDKVNTDGGGKITSSDKLDVQARAINAIETFEPTTITLTNESQSLDCGGKFVTDDIVVPAANIYSTGSSVPSDSSGNNGDIFLIV